MIEHVRISDNVSKKVFKELDVRDVFGVESFVIKNFQPEKKKLRKRI